MPEEKGAAGTMSLSVPAGNLSVDQLRNVTYMLYSRQNVFNLMVRDDLLCIPDCLIEELRENEPPTPEEFTRLLDDCVPDGLTGFDFRDGAISLVFPFSEEEPDRWVAYSNLLNMIVEKASKAVRVFPKLVVPGETDEKYLAHCWLQWLGLNGPDFKADRKILMGHLAGYQAFPTAEKMHATMDKYHADRKKRREQAREALI